MQIPSSVAGTAGLLARLIARHPDAISFASGRPPTSLLPVGRIEGWVDLYLEHESARVGARPEDLRRSLGQYASNCGVIREHLSCYLERTGLGALPPESLMVTGGAQEAISLCLMALARRERVCVSADPVYFGLISAAEALDVRLETLSGHLPFVDRLEERLRAPGGPPIGLVYLVPDFDNPTGGSMPLEERARLVALAERHGFHILEDAAYRHFRYEGPPLPTLKSLDRAGRVIYVESFSKIFLPGLRLAAVAAEGEHPSGGPLLDHLARVKGALSLTTSPFAQAVLAGFLIEHGHRIEGGIARRREQMKKNREALLDALHRHLPERRLPWPEPRGGFYLCVDPGVSMTLEDTIRCAEEAKVLLTPLNLFSTQGRWADHVRLAFSDMNEESVERGVERWAGYLRRRDAQKR